MTNGKKKWYAVYTRPRWEKKVYALLQEKQFDVYCPLNKVRKKWSDRYKIVEEPLFKSYVFVKISEEEYSQVRMIHGVVNFVYWLGKPAIVKEKEIETIKRFLNDYENVIAEPLELSPLQKVEITAGIFIGQEATVLDVKRKKVQVELEQLGYKLIAYIDRQKVSPVKRSL